MAWNIVAYGLGQELADEGLEASERVLRGSLVFSACVKEIGLDKALRACRRGNEARRREILETLETELETYSA